MACAGAVRADAAKGIRVEATTPVVVRGGVIMLPLVAERPGDRWPETFRITLDDGRRIDARVVWIEPAPVTSLSRWALDTAGLAARWVEPGDDTSAGTGAPYIVAQMPEDGSGALRMGDQTLDVTWLDRPRDEAPARPR